MAKSIVAGSQVAVRAQKDSAIQLFDSFVEGSVGKKRITLVDTDSHARRDASSDNYLPENGSVLAIIKERVEHLAKEQAGVWQQVSSNLRGARQFE